MNQQEKAVKANEEPVPNIITEDVSTLNELQNSPIRSKAENINFPLSDEDKKDLVKLILRFQNEKKIGGLSAPQIGINKRAFAFAVSNEDGEEQTFPNSIWINPTYRNASDATLDEGYEVCRSLRMNNTHVAAPVFRFSRINYRAYDTEGRILEGVAHGYAARLIQHEIDHLDGKLFVDYVQPERILTLKDYAERLEAETLDELQTGVVPQFY